MQYRKMLILTIAYVAGAQLGLAMTFRDVPVTAVWPPMGIALAGLLFYGLRLWPGVFAGAFISNIMTGLPLWAAGTITCGNTLEIVAVAWLLQRCSFSTIFARSRDIFLLWMFGAGVGPVLAASVGVATLVAVGKVNPVIAGNVWATWWMGDGMGVVILTPFLLQILHKQWFWKSLTANKLLEFTLLNVLLFAVVQIVFRQRLELTYLVFPFIIWSAIRFGKSGATVSGLIFAITTVVLTVSGYGQFTATDIRLMLFTMMVYNGVTLSVGLFLGVMVDELHASNSVRELSAQIRDLYNNAPCGYHSLDAEGRIVQINDTELRWLGYSREEIAGRGIAEFMSPSSRENFRMVFAGLMREGMLQNVEFELVRRDGTLLPVLVNATAIYDDNGEFIASRSSIIDVTDRKRTEEAFRESQQRFNALSNASFEGILIQEQGVILAANQAMANFFEVESPDDLIGKNGIDILPLTPESKVKIRETIRSGHLEPYEIAVTRKDGTTYPAETQGRSMTYLGRQVRVVAMRDITVRKQAEDVLQQSEAMLRQIIESSPIAMVIATSDFANQYINQTFTQIFGYTAAEIPTIADWWLLAYPDEEYRNAIMQEWNKRVAVAVRESKPLYPMEAVVTCKDGSQRIIEFMTSEIGKRVLIVFNDITRRKQAEQEILREHARTQQVLDTVHTLIVGMDASGCITIINRAGCELLGRAAKELLGKKWFAECLPQPQGMEEIYPQFLEIIRGERLPSSYFEEEILCADGSRRFIGCSNSYVRDDAGTIIGTLISGEDITDRRRREEEEQMLARLQKERRALELRNELMRLTQLNVGSISEILAELLPAVASLLQAEYVSYWTFDEYHEQLTCVRQFSRSSRAMLPAIENATLLRRDYPEYFTAILENRTPLSAPNVAENPITACFGATYHEPLNIRALLDVAVWHRGGVRGVICIEDVGQPHDWTVGEIEFVESAGRVFTFLLESLDRQATQAQLSHSETRFSTVFSGSSLPMVIMEYNENLESRIIVEVNPAFEKTFGILHQEAIGKVAAEVSAGLFGERIRQIIGTELNAHKDIQNLQFAARIADGGTHLFLLSASVISYSDKPHILVIMQDIQEQKEAEQKMETARQLAESANRAKSEFLANISHEVRTPMNAILGFAEILRKQDDSANREKYIDAIIAGGTALMALINDILDLSKIESGGIGLAAEPHYIRSLMDGIQVVFRPKMQEKHLDFNIVIEDSVPALLVLDGVRLRQILYHVIGNAVKFTEQGGITVRVSTQSNTPQKMTSALHRVTLVMEVSDTGVGIAKEQIASIFEAFRQQDGGNTRKYGGAGLGLTITKRLVEAMGGAISVRSDVGGGSAFTITLFNVEAPLHQDGEKYPQNSRVQDEEERLLPVQAHSAREVIKPEIIGWNDGEKTKFAEYAAAISTKYHDRWMLLSHINTMSKNKRFALDLREDARTAGVAPVEKYAVELTAACERFDVAKVKELMQQFPVLLGELAGKQISVP